MFLTRTFGFRVYIPFLFFTYEHLQLYSICDPAKIYFTSKFSYVLFCNPTHKTETGTANRWGTTNSKPHGPIIMIGQSETHQLDQIHYTHFCRCTVLLLCLSSATATCAIMRSQNHFPEPHQHMLDFLHLIWLCRITYAKLCRAKTIFLSQTGIS
jgi:hypothetical protein